MAAARVMLTTPRLRMKQMKHAPTRRWIKRILIEAAKPQPALPWQARRHVTQAAKAA